MQFGFLGINYKKAQLDIRDKTSFTDVKKIDFFHRAEETEVHQCMILSTCNRSEVYFFYESDGQPEKLRQLYKEMFPDVAVEQYLVEMTGKEAMEYLFRVAAGLESLVLGEDQILGQVKEALDFSRTMGYSGKEMNKVVLDAVTCAKRIKTRFRISERPLSVSYIGIQKLQECCGIAGKRVLVIGSGDTAMLALKYLHEYEVPKVFVCSRTLSHAEKRKEDFPWIDVIEYKNRYDCMKECDIVISATSSPHLVVKRDKFEPEHMMVFLDLAAPRDIDTDFMKDDLVKLINLDTLQKIAEENRLERKKLAEESASVLREDLEETCTWLMHSRVDSTIQSLQQRCEEIVNDSYDYLDRKMQLSHREQKLLRKVLNASLQRLLREPIQELKQIDTEEKQDEYREMVKHLFRI